MILIGYKLKYQYHNGDTCEYSRVITWESEIFLTKENAIKSIELIKKKMIENARKEHSSFAFGPQYECEVSFNRSINKFFCDVRRSLMADYKRILSLVRNLEIVPVYARETPTFDIGYYELA